METTIKIHPPRIAEAYYQRLPPRAHQTGDLWKCLPTFELLPAERASAVVITPACDLANDKTPTISYLPIVSVKEYLLSVATYSCIRPAILELLQKAKCQDLGIFLPRFPQPSAEDIAAIISELTTRPHTTTVDKINDGLNVLLGSQAESEAISMKRFASCLGDKWQKTLERIVSNSYADDIHFLPPDTLQPDASAVSVPSLALFRLPLTLKREWFDHHMDNDLPSSEDPLKVARLNPPFLTDLLTRFARLYIRLGAPDLADESVSDLVAKIDRERSL